MPRTFTVTYVFEGPKLYRDDGGEDCLAAVLKDQVGRPFLLGTLAKMLYPAYEVMLEEPKVVEVRPAEPRDAPAEPKSGAGRRRLDTPVILEG